MTDNKEHNFNKWYVLVIVANLAYMVLFYLLMQAYS